MNPLPEDPEILASKRQVIGAGIGSLVMSGVLLYAACLLASKVRSFEHATSFPFMVLFGLTAFPGLAFFGIAFELLRPRKKRAPQMMGSFTLYVISGVFFVLSLIGLTLIFFQNSESLDRKTISAFTGLMALSIVIFRLSSIRSGKASVAQPQTESSNSPD